MKWAAGAAIALYGWVNGALASGVVQLDERLGLGATMVGAHLAAFAVGLLVTGVLATDGHIAPFAPVAFATTLVWFLVAPHPAVSLVACAVLGATGSITLARGQAVLADRLLSADPARTLMIANVVAAGAAATAAATVGAVDDALAVVTTGPAIALGVAALGVRRATTSPTARLDGPTPLDRPAPPRAAAERVGLVLVAVCVAIELTVANQVTGHLIGVGTAADVSDAAVGVLFVGLTLGRVLVAILGTSRSQPTAAWAATAAFVALIVVTAAPNDSVVLAAVLVLGVALGPLFPLAIARLLADADDPARTSALTTSAIGIAVLLAPPATGAATELIGDRAGMAVLTALAGCAVVLALVLMNDRSTSRTTGSGDDGSDPAGLAPGHPVHGIWINE